MFLISIGAAAFSSTLTSRFLPKKEAKEVYPFEIEFFPYGAAFTGEACIDDTTTAGITTAGAAATTTSAGAAVFLWTTDIYICSFFLTWTFLTHGLYPYFFLDLRSVVIVKFATFLVLASFFNWSKASFSLMLELMDNWFSWELSIFINSFEVILCLITLAAFWEILFFS